MAIYWTEGARMTIHDQTRWALGITALAAVFVVAMVVSLTAGYYGAVDIAAGGLAVMWGALVLGGLMAATYLAPAEAFRECSFCRTSHPLQDIEPLAGGKCVCVDCLSAPTLPRVA
jgi:hypothetical protein